MTKEAEVSDCVYVCVCERETETETKIWRYYAAGLEDGVRGHQPRNAGGLQMLERQEHGFSPPASGRNSALLTPRL